MTGLQGGCRCGRVRYSVDGTPFHMTLCHCRDCRQATGAPAVAWFSLRPDELRWTGRPPKFFASSPGVIRSFCPECGTPLTYRNQALDEIDVTTCSLDDPERLPPRDHSDTASQLSWLHLADRWPRFAQSRNDEPP